MASLCASVRGINVLNNFPFTSHVWLLQEIRLYPKGKGIGMGLHISLYLALADPTSLPPGLKIYAEFTLRMLDQMHSRHHYGKGKCSL
jgi:hypothetical protein